MPTQVRFSAYEPDALVTCGRDSVRTYRLKAGQLRGLTVRTAAPDSKVRRVAGRAPRQVAPT
jgi:WD repeat-containing protein 90